MSPSEILVNCELCENSRVIVHGSIGFMFNRCSIYDACLVHNDLDDQKANFQSGIVVALPGLNYCLKMSGRLYYGGMGEVRKAVIVGYLRRCNVDEFSWMLADIESVSLIEDLNDKGLPSPFVVTPADVRYAVECRLKNLESFLTEPSGKKVLDEQRNSLTSW